METCFCAIPTELLSSFWRERRTFAWFAYFAVQKRQPGFNPAEVAVLFLDVAQAGRRRLPASRMANPIHEVAASTSVTGRMVWESNMPMLRSEAATPICKSRAWRTRCRCCVERHERERGGVRVGEAEAGERDEQRANVAGRPNQPATVPPATACHRIPRAAWRGRSVRWKIAQQQDVDLVAADETGGQSGKMAPNCCG